MPPRRSSGSITARLHRSLGNSLSLLHHSDESHSYSEYFIRGSTGNVYTVTLSMADGISCTCPDTVTPCKHILFVHTRVLSLSPHDPRIRRRTLRASEVFTLRNLPISEDSYASETLRKRFREQYKVDDDDDDDDDDDNDNDGNGEQEEGTYINLSDDDDGGNGNGEQGKCVDLSSDDDDDAAADGDRNGEQEKGKNIK